jgi:hypothetical protein
MAAADISELSKLASYQNQKERVVAGNRNTATKLGPVV